MFRLPFSFLPLRTLSKVARIFLGIAQIIEPMFPFLKFNLKQANIKFSAKEYIAICISSTILFFIFSFLIFLIILFSIGIERFFLVSIISAMIVSMFVFIQQIAYPRLLSNRKIRGLEKNLLPALQNMLVQLNSGIPLFNILVNIANADYGGVSEEFKKAVKAINAGIPQVEALEDIAKNNPSVLFRRTIWQVINGMKAGSEMSNVINEAINSLSEEQLIQIQRYGSQLNPLAMFYMLIAVIVPALSVTFIIILSSFISLSESVIKLVFWGLFILVMFIQIMFLGIIKSRRPNLLY